MSTVLSIRASALPSLLSYAQGMGGRAHIPKSHTMDPRSLEGLLRLAGKRQVEAARYLGISERAMSQIKTGDRRLLATEFVALCSFLRLPPATVAKALGISGSHLPSINYKVLGYVGAGGEVYAVDDHAQGAGIEDVPLPPGLPPHEDWAVLIVRGDSMYPAMEEGWQIWFRRDWDGVPTECLNKLCVVRLETEALAVKRLRRGREPGMFTLESVNAPPIEDARIQWAAPIGAIIPR